MTHCNCKHQNFFFFLVAAPSTPTVTAAVSQFPTSITLNWTQPEGESVNSFELVFSYQGPCDRFTHTSTTTVDGTTRLYTLTGLQELSTYTINITASNVGGRSGVASQSVTTRAEGRLCYDLLLFKIYMHAFPFVCGLGLALCNQPTLHIVISHFITDSSLKIYNTCSPAHVQHAYNDIRLHNKTLHNTI